MGTYTKGDFNDKRLINEMTKTEGWKLFNAYLQELRETSVGSLIKERDSVENVRRIQGKISVIDLINRKIDSIVKEVVPYEEET